jgi:mono/diheme cytochrome c family protein
MICKKVLPRLVLIGCGVMVGIGSAAAAIDSGQAPASSATGWQLPPDADAKKSPLTPDAKVIATGKSVFKDKCTKCHGSSGLGDGPDADPEHREDMDLTNPKRADRNSDGVVF